MREGADGGAGGMVMSIATYRVESSGLVGDVGEKGGKPMSAGRLVGWCGNRAAGSHCTSVLLRQKVASGPRVWRSVWNVLRMAFERGVLLRLRQANRWSPNGSSALPHGHWVGSVVERGRRSFLCSNSRQLSGGMRLAGRKRGRLCNGRLVRGERREGRAICVSIGNVGICVSRSCCL